MLGISLKIFLYFVFFSYNIVVVKEKAANPKQV